MTPIPKSVLMARSRQKKKADTEKWAEYLDKDRKRQKKTYVKKKETMTKEALEAIREKNRLKVKRYRLKKKITTVGTQNLCSKRGTYKSPQSFGKAFRKVSGVLPHSPNKRVAVVKELVRQTLKPEVCNEIFKRNNERATENEIQHLVRGFYCCNDISRQAPGKRDVKSVKNEATRKREKIPIRHMLMNVSDAYYEFKKCHPEVKVALSTFFAYRPKFVLPVSLTPHNVCVCKRHLNFSFLVDAVHICTKEFPANYKHLLSCVCCDQTREECMFNDCKTCTYDLKKLLPKDFKHLTVSAKRKKWENVDGFLQVTEEKRMCKDLILELNKQLPDFKQHCLIKNRQHDYFEECKNRNHETEAIVQVDYAENATLTAQNQIQSAHWKQQQVTVFTCCIWNASNVKSIAIISDDMDHSKYSVWTFLKVIADKIKEKFPVVKSLIFFSDNAASQFRSKYTVSNLCYLEDDLGFDSIEWNTFAASHGKGAVDGVGAALKNLIWSKVKAENLNINSAKKYFEVAESSCKKTSVYYVPKEDVKENEKLLDARWDSVLQIVKERIGKKALGLNSLHYFKKNDSYHVIAGQTAKSKHYIIQVFYMEPSVDFPIKSGGRLRYDVYSESDENETIEDQDEAGPSAIVPEFELTAFNIKTGTYVIVEFESKMTKTVYKYVGVCQGTVCEEEGEVLVLFMKMWGKSDKKLFTMDESDKKFVKYEQIKRIIPEPELNLVGGRILYKFK